MKAIILTVAAVFTAAAIAGCCSCREGTDARPYPRTEIRYSSGGGVTGLTTGYTITSDRKVLKWSGNPSQITSIDTVGHIPEEAYREMLEKIYALRPDTIRQMETGNMTASLVIVSDDVIYRYQWAGLYHSDDAVPENVRPLRNAVWGVLRGFYEKSNR